MIRFTRTYEERYESYAVYERGLFVAPSWGQSRSR